MAPQFYSRYIPPSSTSASKPNWLPSKEPHSLPALGKRKRTGDADSQAEKTKRKKKEQAPEPNRNGFSSEFVGEDVDNADEEVQSTSIVASNSAPLGKSDQPQYPGGNVDTTIMERIDGKKAKKKRKKEKSRDQVNQLEPKPEPVATELEGNDGQDEGDAVKHKSILSKFARSKTTSDKMQHKAVQNDGQKAENPAPASIEAKGLTPLPQPDDVPDAVEAPISALPDWLAKPLRVSSTAVASFESLALSGSALTALKAAGFRDALPIQSAVLPILLPGPRQSPGDLCVSAATGSGKTLTYVLPLIDSLKKHCPTRLRAVIVVPTRELVSQVQSTFKLCGAEGKIGVGMATGNRAMKEERKMLMKRVVRYDPGEHNRRRKSLNELADEITDDFYDWDDDDDEFAYKANYVTDYESRVDVLICTPGRLVEHLRCTKGFTLEIAKWRIIDEADRLLDQSFQEWTETVIPAIHSEPELDPMLQRIRVLAQMVARKKVRKIVLSATMTKDVGKLAPLRLNRPRLLVIDSETVGAGEDLNRHEKNEESGQKLTFDLPATLKEVAIPVKRDGDKPLYLVELIGELLATPTSLREAPSKTPNAAESESASSESDDDEPSPNRGAVSGQRAGDAATASGARGMLVFTTPTKTHSA